MLKAFIQFFYKKVQYYLIKWLNQLTTHPKRGKGPCSFFFISSNKAYNWFHMG